MDPRCLDFDHHFAEDDLYEEDKHGIGRPLPKEVQLKARCTRCGTTMGQSLEWMIQELKARIAGKLN